MNIVVRVSFWTSVFVFSDRYAGMIAKYGTFMFFEKHILFLLQSHQFTFSPAVYGSSLFLISASFVLWLSGESHSDR